MPPADLAHYPSLSRRILRVYRSATLEQRLQGLCWWDDAWTACEAIAARSGRRPLSVVVAAAHLSPRIRWADNLAAAKALALGLPKPPQMLNRSWETASAALVHPDPMSTFSRRADKTREFARAIAGYADAVVVDIWACRAAGVDQAAMHSRSGYAFVANAYRAAARREVIPARHLQAICWVVARGGPR